MSLYDLKLQQSFGKWANIVILIVAAGLLAKCLSKSQEEKFIACYVKEMRGQGKHMTEAVIIRCEQKTGFKVKRQ